MTGSVSPRAWEGANKVLTHCLHLSRGDTLAVFYDETTEPTARTLIEAANQLQLRVKERLVRLEHQRAFSPARGLCGGCRSMLRDAAGILTCLSDGTDTTPYRRELVREGPNGGARLGHMPGANLFILEWAVNLDYARASSRCEALALALAIGHTAKVETATVDDAGRTIAQYTLSMDLGGRRRLPVISTGVIPPGTWGNLPGGETFIAPIEYQASGEIAITGAIKRRVLTPPEALVLRFDEGRLSKVSGDPPCVEAFNAIFARAIADGAQNWNVLAELGIGVNEGITELTGNSLFDEKCAGTIHIALGENKGFGGTSASPVHEDIITRKPTLTIDGKPVLDDGKDALREADWQEDLDTAPIEPSLLRGNPRIVRTPERVSLEDGCLRISHQVLAGRTCVYRVGTIATSRYLARIHAHAHPFNQTPLDKFCETVSAAIGLTPHQVKAGVSILMRHGLISEA